MSETNNVTNNTSETDFIDSVKEVNMNIRNHRADDDFEKMLAQLNKKNAPKPAPEPKKPDVPKAEKAEEKPAPKAVPAMAEIAAPAASAPKRKKAPSGGQNVQKKRRPSPAAESKPKETAAKPQTKPAEKSEPEKPAEPAPWERPIFENVEQVWDNPNLSNGGRVAMNVKTDFRKEITITVPVRPEPAPVKSEEPPKAVERAEKRTENDAPANVKTAEAKPKKTSSKKKAAEIREAKRKAAVDSVNKRFAVVNAAACLLIFFGVGFYLLACERESGFIQSENRNLAEFPKFSVQSLIDGSYFEGLSEWYTDTIPGREELKSVSNGFTKLFGVNIGDVKIKGGIAPAQKEELDEDEKMSETVTVNTDFSKTQTSRVVTSGTEELAEVPENLDDGEWMGSVVVSGSGENVRAMSAFYGTFDMGKKYAETINKYREQLDSSVNIYTMNMPISSAYYMPENLADQFTSQHDCIINIGNNLAGIMNVDVYDALDAHKDEYIYSRTDHHWQPLGAYYAAQVFAQRAAVVYPELDTYEECRIEDFVGTMYAYSDYDEELNRNPDTFIYYKPDNDISVTYYDTSFENPQYNQSLFFDYAEGVNCYSAILGRDEEIVEIDTDCDNGRVLVIMKDSFGNALVPFLTHSFSKIYVCDFRYFDINAIDFCYDVGCTDLLFAVSITAAHTESHINAIGNDRIQNPKADAMLPEEVIPTDDAPTEENDEDDTPQ